MLKENKRIKLFLNIAIIFALVASIISLLLYQKQNYNSHEKEMTNLISMVEDRKLEENKQNKLKDYQDYYNNDDIIARLSIDGTNLDTLLVQTTNNKFYLNHTLYKTKDIKGSNFIDYRTSLNSKQINIYGHNSRKGNMLFTELEKYLNKDFYKEHKYINLWDGKTTMVYEVASVYIDIKEHEHIIVNPVNRKDHIDKLSQASIYKTDIDLKEDDDLIILQTCYYKPKNSYLVLVAKRIK